MIRSRDIEFLLIQPFLAKKGLSGHQNRCLHLFYVKGALKLCSYEVSRFPPEMNTIGVFCYQSAPLYQ